MTKRIEYLDSLRGIAAMIVVIFHIFLSFIPLHNAENGEYANSLIKWLTISPLHTIWAGKEAVLLFFVLSGFVLALPFLENKAPTYPIYAVKRFCRIYIPYIVIMLTTTILMMLFSDFKDQSTMSQSYNDRWNHPATLQAVISYIIMYNFDTPNVNGVVWSLFHEMRISLIFPIIMIIIGRFNWWKGLTISLGLTTIFYWLMGVYMNSTPPQGMIYAIVNSFRESVFYVTFFVFGATLAKYRNVISKRIHSVSNVKKVLLLICSLFFINYRWMYLFTNFKGTELESFIPSIGIVILLSLTLGTNWLQSFLNHKPIVFIGKISYSLYLVHIPVIMLLTIHLSKVIPMAYTFILVPFVAIPVAYLSYRLIEQPSIQLGKYLSDKLKQFKIPKIEIKQSKSL